MSAAMQAAISAHNGIAPPLGEAMDRESKWGGGSGEPSAGMEEEEKKLSRRFSTANSVASTDAADDDEEEDGEEGEKGEIVLGPQVALKEQLELDKVHGVSFFLSFFPCKTFHLSIVFPDDVSSLMGV